MWASHPFFVLEGIKEEIAKEQYVEFQVVIWVLKKLWNTTLPIQFRQRLWQLRILKSCKSSGKLYIKTFNKYWLLIQCMCTQSLCCFWLFATPWTVTRQAPLSMESSRQEYWNGLPFPTPGDLSNPRIEPSSSMSPALRAGSLPLHLLESPNTLFSKGHFLL